MTETTLADIRDSLTVVMDMLRHHSNDLATLRRQTIGIRNGVNGHTKTLERIETQLRKLTSLEYLHQDVTETRQELDTQTARIDEIELNVQELRE